MRVGVHPFWFDKGWVGIRSHGSLYCMYNWYLVFSGCAMEYSCDVLQGRLITCFDLRKFTSAILVFNHLVRNPIRMAIVNQKPPMHQLAVLSTGWVAFFHSALDGVHHSLAICFVDRCIFFFLLDLGCFPLGPNLTHSYTTHFPTLIKTTPTNLGTLFIIP